MRNKTISIRPPFDFNQPRVDFTLSRFEKLIQDKGVDVIHERAIVCPCKEKGGDNSSACKNCLGTGWVFVNPIQTKMIVQSMNLSTKFSLWSEEKVGTMIVTARYVDKLNYMDRITDLWSESFHSQILYPFIYQDKLFAYTIYNIESVECLFIFNGTDNKLLKLEVGIDFTYVDNIVTFADKYKNYEHFTVSILFRHQIQYHVLDLVRETRNNQELQDSGLVDENKLPINGIARRSHYVLDSENFGGTLVFDNSFPTTL